jgi:hypothetical protein
MAAARDVFRTDRAPTAIGPYSLGIRGGGPARSTVQGERWPEGSLVAIDAIALAE